MWLPSQTYHAKLLEKKKIHSTGLSSYSSWLQHIGRREQRKWKRASGWACSSSSQGSWASPTRTTWQSASLCSTDGNCVLRWMVPLKLSSQQNRPWALPEGGGKKDQKHCELRNLSEEKGGPLAEFALSASHQGPQDLESSSALGYRLLTSLSGPHVFLRDGSSPSPSPWGQACSFVHLLSQHQHSTPYIVGAQTPFGEYIREILRPRILPETRFWEPLEVASRVLWNQTHFLLGSIALSLGKYRCHNVGTEATVRSEQMISREPPKRKSMCQNIMGNFAMW